MPLNKDPDAIPDDVYWAEWRAAHDAQVAAGEPACGDAPPADVVAAVVSDLDGAQ